MKIALFGGTFDPIHLGHLKAAAAAVRRYGLHRVLFIPSGRPPHKSRAPLTAFDHRYSMVSLACAGNPRFIPSLLEAPKAEKRVCYTVDTVRGVRRKLKSSDELYFLIGIDAFQDIHTWRNWRQLFPLVSFIVVSRPGFASIRDREPARKELASTGPTLHYLNGIRETASARAIRQAARRSGSLTKWVPGPVAEYIRKERLYSPKGAGFLR